MMPVSRQTMCILSGKVIQWGNKVSSLQSVIVEKEQMIAEQKFRLESIKHDSQVSFYTGFQSYKAFFGIFSLFLYQQLNVCAILM